MIDGVGGSSTKPDKVAKVRRSDAMYEVSYHKNRSFIRWRWGTRRYQS
jgi:hypothetical protein